MKKKTVFTIIFVIIAALGIAAGFYFLNKPKPEPQKFTYDLKDEEFLKNAQIINSKLYKSDIDGIFYSLAPTKYYLVKNGKAAPIAPSGTLKISVSDTAFKFNFTIPYINLKGERFGVGEWTSSDSGGIYTYAFAVLKKMPKAVGSDYENLLLIDTDNNKKSVSERTFSEAFQISKSGKSGGQLLDTRNRTVESSGKLRTDWFVYGTQALKHGCYFSGRAYSQNIESPNYDLYKFAQGEDKLLAKNVNSAWLGFSGGGIYYLKQSETNFKSVCLKNGKHEKRAEIEGKIAQTKIKNDYALEGAKLINLFSGKITALNFKKVYDFSANSSQILIVGKEENREGKKFKVQKIMYLSPSGSKVLFANNIMSENTDCEISHNSLITQSGQKTHIVALDLI